MPEAQKRVIAVCTTSLAQLENYAFFNVGEFPLSSKQKFILKF